MSRKQPTRRAVASRRYENGVRQVSNYDPAIHRTQQIIMRAFDELPDGMRKKLHEAWAKHDPLEILEAMRRYHISADEMIKIIENTDITLSINEPMVQGPQKEITP